MEVYICLYGSLSSLSRLLFRSNLSRLLFGFNSNNFGLRSSVISVVSTTRESLRLCFSRGISLYFSLNFSGSFFSLGLFSLSGSSSTISTVSTERSSFLITFSLSFTILLSSAVISTVIKRSLYVNQNDNDKL